MYAAHSNEGHSGRSVCLGAGMRTSQRGKAGKLKETGDMRASQRGNALFRAGVQPLRQPRAPTSRHSHTRPPLEAT